jgi:hypothetical protein
MSCAVVFLGCCAMTMYAQGVLWASYFCMGGAGCVVLYMVCIRNRIALASETLKISCEVIMYNCVDLFALMLLMICVQCIWCTACFVAAIGVYLESKKEADGDGEEASYNQQYVERGGRCCCCWARVPPPLLRYSRSCSCYYY